MKKVLRSIALVTLLSLCLTCFSGCNLRSLRYERYIDGFIPTDSSTIELEVGEVYKPSAAVWLNGFGGGTYSDNEAVAAVNSDGVISAVSVGQAHVVIKGSTSMHEVYLVIVEEPTQEETNPYSFFPDEFFTFPEEFLDN